MDEPYSLTEQIAKHLMRPVRADMRARARLHLLDWLGCVAGARNSALGQLDFYEPSENIISKSAFLGNVLEMDDVHRTALLHPGPVIWPTVLGDLDTDDDGWLDAAVRGYEAMIIVGRMLDAHHYAHFHPTATAGIFGAAAASALLAGAQEDTLAHALSLAGSVTGGLWQTRHEDTMAKQWHIAHAMISGGSAAYFALQGVTGPRFILEGPQGLFAAMCTAPNPIVLPDHWQMADVSFKPWAACRHVHPAIDAALALRAQGHLDGDVLLETYADALQFCDNPHPQTTAEAKFSIQHGVAIIMAGDMPDLTDFEPDVIAALAPLRARVTVRADAGLTAVYPAHFGARITSSRGSVTLADTYGDPERPMESDAIIAKASGLMQSAGLTASNVDHAVKLALNDPDGEGILRLLEAWL
jgi:2-methylcitrate dehydratase PrpD